MFQIGKLRSELEMVSGNVRVMSEMLTELVPTQAEPADVELLQVSPSPAHGSPRDSLNTLVTAGGVRSPGSGLQLLESRAPPFSSGNKMAPLTSASSSVLIRALKV